MKTLHVMTDAEAALAPWLLWMAGHPTAVFGGMVALGLLGVKLFVDMEVM